MILILIKSNILDESLEYDYNYFKILYILQITFASLLSLFIVIFIVGGLVISLGFIQYLYSGCDCEECKEYYCFHKFLLCLLSFFFCGGGLWIRIVDYREYEYCYNNVNCCNFCGICDNCCNVSCIDNLIICDCCCCNKKSCCYSKFCYENCDTCKFCCCKEEYNI